MKPRSLSASAAQVFENCEARYNAEVIQKAQQVSNSAADLGTAFHSTAEFFVAHGWHKQPADEQLKAAISIYDTAYWNVFATRERYDEGLEMVTKWVKRTDWSGRTVLTTEYKNAFKVKTSQGELMWNYIWDRSDELDNGDIEVTDYKTWIQPLQPMTMKNHLQVRIYSLAARIAYPNPNRRWITLDQTRYEPVSVAFTEKEDRETWRYVKALAERIIASDGSRETLNTDCRYCVRKHECKTLANHLNVGGVLSISDPTEAGLKRHKLASAVKAAHVMMDDLDEFIIDYCEENEISEYEADNVRVSIGASGRRVVDAGRVAAIIGPQMAALYPGGINVGVVDRLLKDGRLNDDAKQQLRELVKKQFGEAKVHTKEKGAV